VGTILAYEVWTPLARIAYVEDISPTLDLKRRAMAEHASQLANLAYDEAFCGLNRYRGVMTGRGRYCECFDIETAAAFSLDNESVP
jgi:LmbE family N-acetylglucosaminyl deacetylase